LVLVYFSGLWIINNGGKGVNKIAQSCCGSCEYCTYQNDFVRCEIGKPYIENDDIFAVGCPDYKARNPIKIMEDNLDKIELLCIEEGHTCPACKGKGNGCYICLGSGMRIRVVSLSQIKDRIIKEIKEDVKCMK